MDIQKEKHNYLAMLVAEDAITQEQCSNLSLYNGGNYFHSEFLASSRVDCINWGWSAWLKAKTQAVPKGFVLVPAESLKVALFWMNEDIDPWQMGGDSFADLFEHKPILEKVLIEAQEQGHG